MLRAQCPLVHHHDEDRHQDEHMDGRSNHATYKQRGIAVSISLFLISGLDSARDGAIRVRPTNLISVFAIL